MADTRSEEEKLVSASSCDHNAFIRGQQETFQCSKVCVSVC